MSAKKNCIKCEFSNTLISDSFGSSPCKHCGNHRKKPIPPNLPIDSQKPFQNFFSQASLPVHQKINSQRRSPPKKTFKLSAPNSPQKSKALPIYHPNAKGEEKIPIDTGFINEKHMPIPHETPQKEEKTEIGHLVLMHDPPIVGCQLRAIVYTLDYKGMHENCTEKFDYSVRWFRGIRRLCSVKGCNRAAELQCLTCAKLRVPQRISYFCGYFHLKENWETHVKCHEITKRMEELEWNENDGNYRLESVENMNEKIERGSAAFQCSINMTDYENGRAMHGNLETREALSQFFPPQPEIIWNDCGSKFFYVPSEDDAGRQILAEIRLYEKGTNRRVGCPARVWTRPVMPRYEIPRARKFKTNLSLDLTKIKEIGTFRVMSFNVLADIYAKSPPFKHIDPRFLEWSYRFPYILGEISRYRSSIVCLQEVQLSHYENFAASLSPLGYLGIFKKKTRESSIGDRNAVDGCAIFYDKQRFFLVERFTIEFNEAADGIFRNKGKNWVETTRRLTRDNVALVCLLEDINTGRRVCVANTHLFWDPNFADVKLWQTSMLCIELENLLKNTKTIPIVICGDFNSKPDSAVYKLMTTGSVGKDHPLVMEDLFGIFGNNTLSHKMRLNSSYRSVLKKEPFFTNYTSAFKGCIDYIMYSKELLYAVAALEEYPEEVLGEFKAIPSPRIASDHVPIVTEFSFMIDGIV